MYESGGNKKDSRLKIFSNCTELIEYLPALQRSAKNPTDCMTEPHNITHLPDALRYFVVQYIYPSAPIKTKKSVIEQNKERLLKNNKRKRSFY